MNRCACPARRSSGSLDADFGFTGHYYHQPSGLHLALYRVYDSDLGRWLSRDLLKNAELLQGANLYAYVGNSPVRNTDPSGLSACDLALLNAWWLYKDLQSGKFGGQQPDKLAHCLAHCELAQYCNALDVTAISYGKELVDWLSGGDFDYDDIAANEIGQRCPRKKSCRQWCTSKYPGATYSGTHW